MRALALMVVVACGPVQRAEDVAPAAPEAAPPAPDAAPGPDAPGPDAPAPDEAAPAAAAPATTSREPVLAFDSHPPGVQPLGDADQGFVKQHCGSVMDAARALARKDRNRKPAAAYVAALAKAPPKIKGVDVDKCIALIVQDTAAYTARSREGQAINNIKRIIVGLSGAYAKTGQLCPSAPAVPAALSSLPVTAPTGYEAAGWRCVRFAGNQGAPQHWQYELYTDGDKYSIIARGKPVPGKEVVELFLKGAVKDGAVHPSSDVYRR